MKIVAFACLLSVLGACSSEESDVASITSEHAVLVHFDYPSRDLGPMFGLEERLEGAIRAANVGEFDGNEVGADGSATLFMYGPNADSLFAVVKPVLESAAFMNGAKVVLRYGSALEPNVQESEIVLTAGGIQE